MSVLLLQADARAIPIADETIQCVITSPPYWGLRAYSGNQELVWGGASDCQHQWSDEAVTVETTEAVRWNHASNGEELKTGRHQTRFKGDRDAVEAERKFEKILRGTCVKCGAWRGGFGLEPTIQMYVDHSIKILREVRRVLRKDGVVFWNVGDSYAGSGTMGSGGSYGSPKQASVRGSYFATNQKRNFGSVKPKDLCLIPSRIAIAAQEDGWWVRSLIIWAKPNPMPESVTDRPTDAYEHIVMLTKSENYFFDAESIREPASANTHSRGYGNGGPKQQQREADGIYQDWCDSTRAVLSTRNVRNVWEFATQPFPDAHFATFPEELPRRCILAATSAKGACAQCGAPWERVVRRARVPAGEGYEAKGEAEADSTLRMKMNIKAMREEFGRTENGNAFQEPTTIGWRPTCLCKGQRGKTVPSRVLDPFCGSGTLLCAAETLKRKGFGVELEPGYVAVALERLSDMGLKPKLVK